MPAARALASSLIARHRWLRFVIDHNPCYLLSAACMLVGCYLLNAALHTPAGDVAKLLAVLVVVNLYEACVILLARVLIRYPLVQRDAWIVLFVSGVISTIDAAAGLAINAGLLALAAVKVCVILRLLRVGRLARTLAFILLQIATLLAVPIVFKHLSLPSHGRVSPVAVYLAWWVAGLLPMIGTVLWTLPASRRGDQRQSPADHVLSGLYVAAPFASLLVHLHSAAWVYDVPFDAAFVAPVLIGLAISLRLAESVIAGHRVAPLQAVLLAGAVLVSIEFPGTLSFRLDLIPTVVISPLRLALLAVAAVGAYAFWRHCRYGFLIAGAACVVVAILGPTLSAIQQGLIALGQLTYALAWRTVPRTTLQWGCAAVGAAFALLGLGAIVSRRKLADAPGGADAGATSVD